MIKYDQTEIQSDNVYRQICSQNRSIFFFDNIYTSFVTRDVRLTKFLVAMAIISFVTVNVGRGIIDVRESVTEMISSVSSMITDTVRYFI